MLGEKNEINLFFQEDILNTEDSEPGENSTDCSSNHSSMYNNFIDFQSLKELGPLIINAAEKID